MTFEVQLERFPQLTTRNLILRQMYPTDAEAVFNIFSDDEVTRYYDLETFTSIEQATQLIQRQTVRFEQGEGLRWGITHKGDNVITCGVTFALRLDSLARNRLNFGRTERGGTRSALFGCRA